MMKKTWIRVFGVAGLVLLAVLLGSRLGTLAFPNSANSVASQSTLSCAAWRSGSGMMGNGSSGMMGGSGGLSTMGSMWGLMGNMGMMSALNATAQPISEAQARQKLDAYAASCGHEFKVDDVTAFASNYYGSLVDASGTGYLEVIVDRFTGAIYPEPQSMMWNTKSGMHASRASIRYNQAAAQQLATTFLASYLPGAKVVDANAFPGYYTFDFGGDKALPVGMLSVNASTGQVWVHTWHGPGLGGA